MTRRTRSLAYAGLLGAVAVLAFPGSSSALLGTYGVELSASGPSPAGLTIPVLHRPIMFTNADTVAHTVTFDDSSCSGEVAPGAQLECAVPAQIGTYSYTVDGTTKASVRVTPEGRRVTLSAKRHGFRPSSMIVLRGTLQTFVAGAPPQVFGLRMPIMVFARPDRLHPWHRVGVVMAHPLKKRSRTYSPHSVWQLSVRPHAHTTYVAVAKSDLEFWERAQSKPFGVYARRR